MNSKNWKTHIHLIKSVINEWDPIGDSPDDEYDDLIFGIQSRLNQNLSDTDICSTHTMLGIGATSIALALLINTFVRI